MTSNDYLNQINDLQTQFKNLGVADPNQIYGQFAQKVQGFKPQYDELARANTQAYAAPAQVMQDYQTQYGPGMNAGPDAFSRLNVALNKVGQYNGTATALGNSINSMQGNLQGIANSVGSNISALGQNLGQQIGYLTPLYQSQLQNEQFKQSQDLQRAQLASQQAAQTAPAFPDFSGGSQSTSSTPVNQLTKTYIYAGKSLINSGVTNPNDPRWQQIFGYLKSQGISDPTQVNFNSPNILNY